MKKLITVLLCLPLPVHRLHGEERIIQVPQVSLRAGPALHCEPTDLLSRGDRVDVLKVQHGFVAVRPIPSSFNLIAERDVMRSSPSQGTVKQAYAQTIVGSSLTHVANQPGTTLQRGAKVHVLENVIMVRQGRPESFLKITPPAGEFRYLPATALEPVVAANRGHDEMTAFYPPDAQTAMLLREADEAYQRGMQSGNWEEARSKYAALANSPNHHARMTALNRLEFIRVAIQRNPFKPAAASESPAGMPQQPPLHNPDWQVVDPTKVAARAATGDRLPPTQTTPATPFSPSIPRGEAPSMPNVPVKPAPGSGGMQRPVLPTSQERPVTPARDLGKTTGQQLENRFPQPSGPGSQRQVGILVQAYQSSQAKPLFYLTNHQGNLVCFVTPVGVDLRPFAVARQPVELHGGPLTHRLDLNGQHMTVHQVTPLTHSAGR